MSMATHEFHLLLVEDEQLFAKAVCRRLQAAGYHCSLAHTLTDADARMKQRMPDLILLDMRLPDGAGLDLLTRLSEETATQVPVIMMTAYGEIDDAVAAMKLGALDYLKKPLDLEELILAVEKALNHLMVRKRLDYSLQRESRAVAAGANEGVGKAFTVLREEIHRIATLADRAETPPTVLILGETGSGKDVAARLLHHYSQRHERPFMQVDCAVLAKELIEAELFGHERGAFTGAGQARVGLVEAAEDGVLFLDEIGELPLELQAKLLTLLERRSYRRVGSSQERSAEAWFIAATNRPLEEMVAAGTLRSDLYFRLKVLTLQVPPLRERAGDVPDLINHFSALTARRFGIAEPIWQPRALNLLQQYHWPGNVRELAHMVERAVLMGGGNIEAEALCLPPGLAASQEPTSPGMGSTLEMAEARMIREALDQAGGNVSEAARQLGITRMALRYRMDKYSIGSKV
jgi:two-component system, NtrC family, response regulator AtoC